MLEQKNEAIIMQMLLSLNGSSQSKIAAVEVIRFLKREEKWKLTCPFRSRFLKVKFLFR